MTFTPVLVSVQVHGRLHCWPRSSLWGRFCFTGLHGRVTRRSCLFDKKRWRTFSTITEDKNHNFGLDREFVKKHLEEHSRLLSLIEEYQNKGHLIGKVDPLNIAIEDPGKAPFKLSEAKTLQKEFYGFSDSDLAREFYIGKAIPLLQVNGEEGEWMKLGDLLKKLEKIYSGELVTEFSHIVDHDCAKWVHEKVVENAYHEFNDKDEKLSILNALLKAQQFENFCGKRFSGAKRFSLEGSEVLIPGLLCLFEAAANAGVEQVELGMTHRGRLNVLRNVLDIPMEAMLANFQEYLPDNGEYPNNSDDVRYHLGTTRSLYFDRIKKKIRISLAANPSHLEAVNAVVLGKTRARQFLRRGDVGSYSNDSPLGKFGSVDYSPGDSAKHACMAVLLHGDASFYQGSVRETIGFSNLRDYTTGGTIHIVLNNQIGFTTMPKESHSSMYCSDVAKLIGAPVFHVNGDNPEKVIQAFKTAMEYRHNFMKDCVVNLWCYRRHGHNEQDKPELTQPIMYSAIASHRTTSEIYFEKLKHEGYISAEEFEQMKIDVAKSNTESYNNLQLQHRKGSIFALWNEVRDTFKSSLKQDEDNDSEIDTEEDKYAKMVEMQGTEECMVKLSMGTGVNEEMLRSYGRSVFTLPPRMKFKAHRKVVEIMKNRLDSVNNPKAGKTIQWAAAEALAFASLLVDGFHIRLSGQDVERGTFNQRHAVLYDQEAVDAGEEVIYKPWTELQSRSWHRNDMRKELLRRHSSSTTEPITPSFNGENQGISVEAATAAAAAHIRHAKGDVENESLIYKSKFMLRDKFTLKEGEQRSSNVGVMEVCNSPLSEEAVLGFEHGYSLYSPSILTIWEAQFGDFANCAQTIIDTFIVSGEEKWVRPSGLVMLLPHGYEGQGPDHSSARLERFLQLCAEDDCPEVFEKIQGDGENIKPSLNNKKRFMYPSSKHEEQLALANVNIHVLMLSTPAQYFHALRRQMILPVRKPLVIMTPKSLLHHKPCSSSLAEMDIGTAMQTVIDDSFVTNATRVIFCSGKVYYYLLQTRKVLRLEGEVAIVRLEQLCPFPFFSLEQIMKQYEQTNENVQFVWAQEEPKNMGCWYYVQPRLMTIQNKIMQETVSNSTNRMRKNTIVYKGRPVSASPATGSFQLHREEMMKLAKEALIG